MVVKFFGESSSSKHEVVTRKPPLADAATRVGLMSREERRRNRTLWFLGFAMTLAFTGCGDDGDAAGTPNRDAGPESSCENDDDCPFGLACMSNKVCSSLTDDNNELAPDIEVAPSDDLEFGSPLIGTETTADVTIQNIGRGPLEINAVLLFESDLDRDAGESPEFSLEPLDLPLFVAPGRSRTLTVSLRPDDDDEDLGQIAISSNDPKTPSVVINLVSDLKGEPVLHVCVPPTSGAPEPCMDAPVLDFGEVLWGVDTDREFTLTNDGDGNRPIRVERLSTTGLAARFDIETFAIDALGDEVPVDLPQFLSPAGELQAANILHVRVTFDASVDDSVLGDSSFVHLEWEPEAPSIPGETGVLVDEFDLPIRAEFLNCATNRWDLRTDLPGCEYACVFSSSVDVCDGTDSDCDGTADEDFDASSCGVGRCASLARCVGGALVCGSATALDTTCDGEDDDCDGSSDEEYSPYNCGFGICTASSACVAGVESCTPGVSVAELCDDLDNDCDGTVDDGCDDDGDGWCDATLTVIAAPAVCSSGVGDCDDSNSGINPAGSELCDDNDNNCDGATDEGCDSDDDGYCDAEMTVIGSPAVCSLGADDCNDEDATVSPGAVEVCNDRDDDCLLGEDNGCDDDGDGFCDAALGLEGSPEACPLGGGDCNDTDPTIGPATVEACDGINNDCDLELDEGCDDDGDDYCDTGLLTVGRPAVCPNGGGDCNDSSATINPAGIEVCDDIDNNCAAGTDEGCDDDNDNFCDTALSLIGSPATCTNGGGDCNDTNSTIHPTATDICDNVDNNCDADVDEGCDDDGDDYCDSSLAIVGLPPACPLGGGDCSDTDSAIHPGVAEICDGLNNNCVAGTDEGCDDDDDNYCEFGLPIVGTPPTCTAGGGDCNDTNSGVNPGATEVCDNVSNDCDAAIDEGCDDDNDNYCDAALTIVGPPFPTTCTAGGGDCNDTNATINPSMVDICDGVDNNCAMGVDEGCDDDNDNFCDSSKIVVGSPPTCTAGGGDCNDSDAAVFPGALERCDSLNNDCDADGVDEGCDDDNDNFCDSTMVVVGAPSTCTGGGGDCVDTNSAIHPSAIELCDDIDNNCTAGVDDNCDDDNDNYCDAALVIVGTPSTCTSGGGDCADSLASVYPGALEVCDNIDNNCTGSPLVDEGCDDDNDNYCDSGITKAAATVVTTCTATPAGATVGNDCNDANSAVNPSATEICDDVDNNCAAGLDEGCDDDNDNFCDGLLTIVGPPFPSTCTSGGGDCNDTNAAIGPGTAEICNNLNDDCDASTDEGCDDDDDNFCDSALPKAAGIAVTTCSATPAAATTGDDCNDADALVHPGAAEICNNTNDDCDSAGVDEGCDDDDDNFCDSALPKTAGIAVVTCTGTPTAATAGNDCNDTNAAINPAAIESCNNTNDDCDGATDEGCDDDDDNYCDSGMAKSAATIVTACPLTPATATVGDDCNDAVMSISPAATEICDNVNNDCDAAGVDEGCDDDNDDYCDVALVKAVGVTVTTCTATPALAALGNDCNDSNAAIRPSATELCDNQDNNCASGTDEGCDDDGDDYCDAALAITGTPSVCPRGGGDCNDANAAISPGAIEICDNIDNNCAAIDEGCDDDNDDYCDSAMSKPAGITVSSCPLTPAAATVGNDCLDTNSSVNPAATEICNNINDDCGATTDEGCDDDNDDYCDSAMSITGAPIVCPRGAGDCNDLNAAINPGAVEICDNLDNTCGGTPAIDEGCDDDDDNYCDSTKSKIAGLVVTTCTATPAATTMGDDCDDMRSSANPGALEICDGTNNDCDAAGVDEGCDDDDDNYCDSAMTLVGPPYPGTCTAGGGDCADTVAARNPGVAEICDDVDNDCLGGIDNGCDDDDDNFCDATMAKVSGASVSACPNTPAAATVGDDCNDVAFGVHPGAVELCNDMNDDCDAAGTDEGCDDDNDNYCDAAMTRVGVPSTCTAGGGDCADTVAARNPGVAEICDNVDNNCAGTPAIDEGCDDDGDDYCDATMSKAAVTVAVCPLTSSTATIGNDCNDVAAGIHPLATEVCNNGDEDCDMATDEGCDDDGDDYCDATMSKATGVSVAVCPLTPTAAAVGNDCNDTIASVNPAGIEVCNALDDNCNGTVDDGIVEFSQGENSCGGLPFGTAGDNPSSSVIISGVIHTADEDWYQVTVTDDFDPALGCSDDDEFNLRACWGLNPGNTLRADLYRGGCPPGGPCSGGTCACTDVSDIAGVDARWEYASDGICPEDEWTNMGGPLWVRVYRPGGSAGCSSYSLTIANGSAACP